MTTQPDNLLGREGKKCANCQNLEPGDVIHLTKENNCFACGRKVGSPYDFKDNGWRERFDENCPKTDEKLLGCRGTNCESESYYFGYKYKKDGEIYEVTDWGNIKSFIQSEIDAAILKERELLTQTLEGEKLTVPYYGVKDYPEVFNKGIDIAIEIIREAHLTDNTYGKQ
jgi:hypothetical protein